MKNSTTFGTAVFRGSEDGREYGGESGSGGTTKGYQPGETLCLSPSCRVSLVDFLAGALLVICSACILVKEIISN